MKIKKLKIHRMPGFPNGLKGFDKLAGNVNVIAGPNGSGKSSTARVIQKLIWWNNKTTGYQLDAEVDVQDELNRIEIDSQSYIRTDSKKKTQEDFSYISPAEFSNQYMLALHDLVKDNDDNLAGIIAREVNGGVDLRKATEKLGYKQAQPNLGHPAYREYSTANATYHQLEKEQAGIIKDEENLQLLEDEKKQSVEASKLREWYEKALHYLKSKESYNLISTRMEQFPLSLARMKEDDIKAIENLEQRIRAIDLSLTESASIIETNKQKIDNLRLSNADSITDEQVHELAERIALQKDLIANINTCEREIKKQQLACDHAAGFISSEYELAGLRELNLKQVRNLSEFIRTANEISGSYNSLLDRKEQLEKELDTIKSKLSQSNSSADNLSKGAGILSEWLKTHNYSPAKKEWPWWILPVWGIVAVLSGFYGGIAGMIAIIVLSLILVPILLKLNKPANHPTGEMNIRIADYEKLKLPPPSAWESEAVATQIHELLKELEIHIQKRNLEEKITQLCFEIEKVRTRLNETEATYQDYRQSIGILPEKLEQLTDNYNSFYAFLCNMLKWQETVTELEKLDTEKQAYTENYNKQQKEIDTLLQSINFPSADNPEQASARLQSILKEKEIRKDALNEIAAQNKITLLRQQERSNSQDALQEIYQRLEITFGQKNDILLMHEQFNNYIKVREQLNQEQANLNANFKLLQDNPLYEQYKEVLPSLTIDEVQLKIKEYEIQAERQKEIFQKVAEVSAQVKDKKARNDIEVALNRKEEAITGLNELLKSNLKSVTGGMIISHLHEEISLNNENQVFKQANQILGSITKGRYNLILSEGLQPTFRALDNVLNHVQNLTEISTGTRVQLLLAIRLAYIESQENTVKLPLLADELLANSDDERSEAIIRSLIEISRNRQLFYFTAQADEVEKWKHYMQTNPELESEIIQLGNKIIEYDKTTPAIKPIILAQEVCSPAGFDHESYGNQIEVPAFDILEQGVSEIHLWYLIEDTNLLYTCLKQGLYQWGQLNSFLENAGRISGLDDNLWKSLKSKILVFDRFKEMYSLGRSRKINREILVQSGAVTDVYLDKMSELLHTTNYDAKIFLDALDAGAIKGFRANKKEELRTYLLENNYISTASPYDEEDIRIKISALISNMDMGRSEAERFLNRFLAIQ